MDIPERPRTDFCVDITDTDVEYYREHGYLKCPQLAPDEEIDWLNEVYDAFLDSPRSGFLDGVFDLVSPYGTLEQPKVGQLLMPEQKCPELKETALWKNARKIATKLLNVDDAMVENWGHLIFKSPHCENVTPWHQDEAYWDPGQDYLATGCWVPLQDVDETNGCLWFVPDSHRSEVLDHRHYGDDPAVHILEIATQADTSSAVPIPLMAGEATFHNPRTLHFAGPNSTAAMRKAWANEFQTQPVSRQQAYDRPWVHEGRAEMARRYENR